jgi:hypothetical protein
MEHDVIFSKAKEAVENATLHLENKKEEYVQDHNSKKKYRREQRRKCTRCLEVPSGCKVGL